MRFSLPPLSEQRAIAGVLDAIEEAIERTEGVIAATEQPARLAVARAAYAGSAGLA